MKNLIAVIAAITVTGTLAACGTTSVSVKGSTERTETVKDQQIVETGTPVPEFAPAETTTTRTEKSERLIETGPAVK